jgi:hypothetical protein
MGGNPDAPRETNEGASEEPSNDDSSSSSGNSGDSGSQSQRDADADAVRDMFDK